MLKIQCHLTKIDITGVLADISWPTFSTRIDIAGILADNFKKADVSLLRSVRRTSGLEQGPFLW